MGDFSLYWDHHKVYMGSGEQFGFANVFIATTVSKTATPVVIHLRFGKRMILDECLTYLWNNVVQTQPYRPDVSLTGKIRITRGTFFGGFFSAKGCG